MPMNYLSMTPPDGIQDLLLVPVICAALALIFWSFGVKQEIISENRKLKWFGVIPVLIGLFYGLPIALRLQDYAYMRVLPSRKIIYSHYLAAGIPLLALVIILIWFYVIEKRRKQWYLH